MLPILNLGPLSINSQLLIIFAGIWIGISFSEKYAPLRGISSSKIGNLIFTALIAGIIGARLGYVMQYFSFFVNDPLAIVALKPVMFDLATGLLVGILSAYVYIQKKRLNLLSVLDALVPGLAIFSLAMGFSHLASGDAYGIPTSLPWGIFLWGELRHPTQIYEIITAIIIIIAIWPKRRVNEADDPKLSAGLTLFLFLTLHAGSQILIESFKADSALFYSGIRTAHFIWWLVLLVSLLQLNRLLRPILSENE